MSPYKSMPHRVYQGTTHQQWTSRPPPSLPLHSAYARIWIAGVETPASLTPGSTRPVASDAAAACRAPSVSRNALLHSPLAGQAGGFPRSQNLRVRRSLLTAFAKSEHRTADNLSAYLVSYAVALRCGRAQRPPRLLLLSASSSSGLLSECNKT
jgi:hypothetical protein